MLNYSVLPASINRSVETVAIAMSFVFPMEIGMRIAKTDSQIELRAVVPIDSHKHASSRRIEMREIVKPFCIVHEIAECVESKRGITCAAAAVAVRAIKR